MEESSVEMAEFCRKAEELLTGKFLFAEFFPRCGTKLNNYNRFLMCLAGRKHIIYGDGQSVQDRFLDPGDVIFVPGSGEESEVWDSPHEMISCVFMSSFTRVIHIAHGGDPAVHPSADIFYHIPKGVIAGEGKVAEALLELKNSRPSLSLELMRLLLRLLEETLARIGEKGLPEPEWRRVCEAMHRLFRGNISREDVAELAEISPGALSKLVKKHTCKSFREFVNDHRLEYALSMLRQSKFTVKEISSLSGFSYPSYFIRLFKARYGMSPEHFRQVRFTLPDPKDPAYTK